MQVGRIHRIGFLATLATGVAMLGASVWGMAGVEADLRAAAAPQRTPTVLVSDRSRAGDCPAPGDERAAPAYRDQV